MSQKQINRYVVVQRSLEGAISIRDGATGLGPEPGLKRSKGLLCISAGYCASAYSLFRKEQVSIEYIHILGSKKNNFQGTKIKKMIFPVLK